jgi:hypothetical protein
MAEAIPMAKNDQQSHPLQVFVEGKITASRYADQKYYTTLTCKAADEYSQPPVLEIRSRGQLGAVDQIFKGNCKLGGYLGKPFQVTDRQTGAQRQARNCNMTLDLVE